MNTSEDNKIVDISAQVAGMIDDAPSRWREQLEFSHENTDWLSKSSFIALKVLDALEEKGLKKVDLAMLMGVERQQINKIIKGQENLTLKTIVKLERVLGIVLIPQNNYVVKNIVRAQGSYMTGTFISSPGTKSQTLINADQIFDLEMRIERPAVRFNYAGRQRYAPQS